MLYIFIALIAFAIGYSIYKYIMVCILFEYFSPNQRTCKRCDAIQNNYHYNWDTNNSWWEETVKGKDEKCKCKRFVDVKHKHPQGYY
jgi:hypothetical protein